MGYPKSRHYTPAKDGWLGADCERWEGRFGEAHSLGQGDPESAEECGLSGIGLGDAARRIWL
ncbi:MAG: hypothetical protein JOY71_24245 [Acetobacteraceae bacterium]|nr:hypothetical protein [Acetobacteraceae bacterium]